MCLVTKRQQPSVAESDMTVYKLLIEDFDNVLCGPIFSSYSYLIDTLNETEMEESNNLSFADTPARDAIVSVYGLFIERLMGKEDGIMVIGKGFHSCKSLERAIIMKSRGYINSYIYKCIIPKGAEYYEDMSGLVVSNKLIVKERV